MAILEQQRESLVLVVADDESARASASSLLEAGGFTVRAVATGEKALEAFAHEPPDLVLLDADLPDMNGLETCAALRGLRSGAQTPIVLLTDLEDYDSVTRAFEVGATDFISKPFNPLVLEHRTRHVVRTSRMLSQLARNEAVLAKSQQLAGLGSWEYDVQACVFTASVEARRLLEYGAAESLTFDGFLSRLAADDSETMRAAVRNVLRDGATFALDQALELPSGTRRMVRTQGEASRWSGENSGTIVGTLQDVTEAKDVEERIHALAYYDSLTGLPNRLLFAERLRQSLAQAERDELKVAVLFIDLDRFKRINDTLGHDAGDQLLAEVAQRLTNAVRYVDSVSRDAEGFNPECCEVARLGGDEFTVVLTSLKYVQDAAKVAKRILEAFGDPVELAGHKCVVTASVGIALYPMDGLSGKDLLKHSDTAMYHAKEQGKNNFQFFSSDLNAKAFERLTVENGLRRGLENDELVVYYQPRVSVLNGRIQGFEGLVRWDQEGVGLVSPSLFLKIADEAGLVARIDRVVLTQACRQLSEWQRRGLPDLRVAVNISDAFFRQPEFVEAVAHALKDHQLRGSCLELELREKIITDNPAVAAAKLEELRALGVRLAIDNFGIGLSCLSQLRGLPFEFLKIDRSFARDLGRREGTEAVVAAVVALGHSLGLEVVAEGVETPEQFEMFRAYGCESVQGYYFSEPLAAAKVEGFVETFQQQFDARTYV